MCWFTRLKIRKINKQLKSLHQFRTHNQATDEAINKEIALYMRLATIYEHLKRKKKFPYAHEQVLACYRAASTLDDSTAQFNLGNQLLEEAKFRDNLQQSGIFASESNALFMKELYKEAHAFLLAAEKQQHIKAKRIRGLCYISGWGVPVDKDYGFDLIVASIEQENSWDRVQKIFAEIGINKPAFLSELFQHRKK